MATHRERVSLSEGWRLSAFALGGVALAGVTSPVFAAGVAATFPAVDWLRRRPPRGASRLARLLSERESSPEAMADELAAFIEREKPGKAIELEARGWRALFDLEAGRLDRSCAEVGTFELPEKLPALGRGRVAALAHALHHRLGLVRAEQSAGVSELVPEMVANDWGPQRRQDYDAVLASLALHQSATEGTERVVEANWRRVSSTQLFTRWPTMGALAAAAAAPRVPDARTMLEGWSGAWLSGGAITRVLARVFPRLDITSPRGGYRAMSSAPGPTNALAWYRPPESIREMSEAKSRERARKGLRTASRVLAGPVGALLVAGGGLPASMAALVLGMWSLRRQRLGRAPGLAQMPQGPVGVWLKEMGTAPDAPLGERGTPLRREQVELYMACIRAEQELARGDAEAAWGWLAWWFADRDYKRAPSLSLEPVASTLLRVSCLANRNAEARSLAHVLRPAQLRRAPRMLGRGRRTIYGDAPRALGLARALVYARGNAWSEAARALKEVSESLPVHQTERDEVLYALMSQRVRGMVKQVDPVLCRVSPRSIARVEPWLERVWPQLLGAG